MKKKNIVSARILRRLTAFFAVLLLSLSPTALALTIPGCITQIEEGAFEGADSFTTVDIPESVVKIGDNAFMDCVGIEDIFVWNGGVSLGKDALGIRENITLHAPMGSMVQTYAATHNMPFQSTVSPAAILLEYAATQLGTPYSTHDCVTYVHECYLKALGIRTYATCRDVETKTKGVRINKIEDLKPGDIICWKNDTVSYCTHVGMYVGPGKVGGKTYTSGVFIESSNGAGFVRYNYIPTTGTSYYTRNFMGAWRII